jgi:hypothetical protein
MALQKYDVIYTMIPFSTEEDRENGHKTLNSYRLAEAQLSGEYKERPCIVMGRSPKSGNIVLAEIRSNRNKSFRSMLNNPAEAGIDHESSILTSEDQLIHVDDDISPSLESSKCGHLSKQDIARFEKSFMELNYSQQVQPTNQRQYETLEERERRIERELDEQLAGIEATPKSEPSDKQLLTKLKDIELDYSSNVKEKSREYGD